MPRHFRSSSIKVNFQTDTDDVLILQEKPLRSRLSKIFEPRVAINA